MTLQIVRITHEQLDERKRPGELVHIDVMKLGRIGRPGHRIHGNRRTRSRGIGWEYVHICIDDATRLAYIEVLADETAVTAAAFLRRARSLTTAPMASKSSAS